MNHEPGRSRGSRPQESLRTLVLGAGGQGMRRAQAVRLAAGWELSGLHDSDPARNLSASKRLKCQAWPDLAAALESARPHVVVIATPPFAHEEQIEAALAANCHVLCEKPLTIRPESAHDLADEAERRGLILATGFNHRFFGPVIDALALARSNRFGPIRNIDAFIGHPPTNQILEGWLGDRSRSGGGVLIDNGSHLIDLLRLFLGDLGPVTLEDLHWHDEKPGIETKVEYRCRGASGATAQAVCSWEDPDRPYLSMRITFERGTASFSAFPWTSEFVESGGRGRKNAYAKDRIVAKFLGFRAAGLEPSLMRELGAIRRAILGHPVENAPMPFATARDGARAAEVVRSIVNQATIAQDGARNDRTRASLERRCA